MAWYTGNLLYDILLLVGFLYAAGIFASARFGTAAYGGKFGTRSKGLKLGPKQGWILMEIPALIFFPLFFFMGSNAADPVPLFLLGVWMFHYTNRALVNPMLMRVQPGSQPSFNINVVVIGWVVLVLHGYLNGAFVGGLAPHLHGADWFSDPRFVIGLIVYACGFTLNVWSDKILRDLRPKQPDPNAPRYVIPTKGPFKYVTCPHYLGELTSFLGFSIMTWGLGGVYILAVSAANLVPRARVTHRWYHRTFPDYPKDRKAIIPFIY